uniref:Uncharacterized protein n=1 Tax=Globodera pallida TaxID=36090 RepID=A0A183CA36_GLOPA
MTTENKMNDEK